jgi:hypothetical protein
LSPRHMTEQIQIKFFLKKVLVKIVFHPQWVSLVLNRLSVLGFSFGHFWARD